MATEYLRGGELVWIAVEMVGRAGFKFCEFSLRPEPATSLDCRLSIYGVMNWLELLLRWWVVQDLNSANLAYGLNLQPAWIADWVFTG
nr:hypothetical protein [Providencia rettgeri]